jgi:hypothetical protein
VKTPPVGNLSNIQSISKPQANQNHDIIKNDKTTQLPASAHKPMPSQKYNENIRTLIENSKLKSLNSTKLTPAADTEATRKTNNIKPNILHKKNTLEVLENITLNKLQNSKQDAPVSSNTDNKTVVYDYYHPLSFIYVKLIDSYLLTFNLNKSQSVSINLNQNNVPIQDTSHQTTNIIDDVQAYKSPLVCFKGYR